jgi:hypothetical protein
MKYNLIPMNPTLIHQIQFRMTQNLTPDHVNPDHVNPDQIIYTNIARINRIPEFDELYAIRQLYYETHIVPSEEDFLGQLNNHPVLYLVLYWLNLEHLYPRFLEEEMDLEAVRLMEDNDFRYFNIEGIGLELFRQYVAWLRMENTNENINISIPIDIIPMIPTEPIIHTSITNTNTNRFE